MRTLFRLLPFMLVLVIVPPGFGQAKEQSFSLTIGAVKSVVKVRSKIRLQIELKNTSDHDIELTAVPWGKEDHPELEGFRPIVTDSQGKPAPLTKWGRLVFGRSEPSDNVSLSLNAVTTFPLAPGKIYKSEILLSDLYDLSLPGTYAVEIPRYDNHTKQEMKSNAVTVSVVH